MALAAPTKFRPLSEKTWAGQPRRPTKRLKAAMKHPVVISETDSRWMTFVAKQTKTHSYPFDIRHPRSLGLLMSHGPAKSRPAWKQCFLLSFSAWEWRIVAKSAVSVDYYPARRSCAYGSSEATVNCPLTPISPWPSKNRLRLCNELVFEIFCLRDKAWCSSGYSTCWLRRASRAFTKWIYRLVTVLELMEELKYSHWRT